MYRPIVILTTLLFAVTIPGLGSAGENLPGCEFTPVAASPVGAVIGPYVPIIAKFDQTGIACQPNFTCNLIVNGVSVANHCDFPGPCGTDTHTGAVNACHPSVSTTMFLNRGVHTVVAQISSPGTTPGTGAVAWTIVVQ